VSGLIEKFLNLQMKKLKKDGTVKCPKCGSENAYLITRVTGYFSKTSMWTPGKIMELRQRRKTDYQESKGFV
jgi:anaerobic ribonucleoside-triphosphate reductase